MLGRNVIVTPPPSVGRGCGSRARPVRSESAASVPNDAYFSSGARSSVGQSTFHSVSSAQLVTTLAMGTFAMLTEESSGSGTVVPLFPFLFPSPFPFSSPILYLLPSPLPLPYLPFSVVDVVDTDISGLCILLQCKVSSLASGLSHSLCTCLLTL